MRGEMHRSLRDVVFFRFLSKDDTGEDKRVFVPFVICDLCCESSHR
jgi:hypothetical protein